jgi:hypothetical protein
VERNTIIIIIQSKLNRGEEEWPCAVERKFSREAATITACTEHDTSFRFFHVPSDRLFPVHICFFGENGKQQLVSEL